jgi:hypothetical protein
MTVISPLIKEMLDQCLECARIRRPKALCEPRMPGLASTVMIA